MQRDWLFILKTLVEVFPLEHLRDSELRCQPDPIRRLHLVEPLAIETNFRLGLRKNLPHLRHVGLRIAHDFFRAQRRARGRAARGVADHAREIADQKCDGMSEVLKMLQLAQQDGVA